MRAVYEERLAEQSKIERRIVQDDAQLCRSPFGVFCKAWWKNNKVAENLAAEIGCSVRSAAYQISGEHKVSGEALAWLTNLMVHGEKKTNGKGNGSSRQSMG